MKLVHPKLEGQIIFSDEKPCQWVIESPEDFSLYVQELLRQSEGEEGQFVLSDGDKEKDISKYAEVIINPFAVNINDRKILTPAVPNARYLIFQNKPHASLYTAQV